MVTNTFQLCDHLFDKPKEFPKKLDDLAKDRDLTTLKAGVADLKVLVSMTIVHEVNKASFHSERGGC